MIKPELLSPAGDFLSFKEAVHNGADAIYLSGKNFGARRFAPNFTNEELIEAIKYAHLYGVKVYVTVNTLIHDDEIDNAINYLRFLYENNVDAVIMQDIGLITLARSYLPDLEIHASTQMHNINSNSIKELESLGVKRVVLARELSIDEINKIETNVELEVFIHGALCISYSGECLFSSEVLSRSGNRGECAGMCRLPYKLYENDKLIDDAYILSTKELMTLPKIGELLSTNKISSLKIEGRMKSSTYVGFITRLYRKAIDSYYNGIEYNISNRELLDLKSIYNREFTVGNLFNESNEGLMNTKSPNHIGYKVGEVISFNNKRIKIKLLDDLNQEDGIRFGNNSGMICNFIYKNDLLVSSASNGSIIEVDNKINLDKKCDVYKTSSKLLENEYSILPDRNIPVNIIFNAYTGSNMSITISDNKNTITVEGEKVEEAINAPLKEDRIKDCLLKLGDTPFKCNDITINISSNIFIPISSINDIRRRAVNELIEKRISNKEVILGNINYKKYDYTKNSSFFSSFVKNEEQLLSIADIVDIIYVDNIDLYNKYKDKYNIYYRTSRIELNKDIDNVLVGDLGNYNYHDNNICDYFLNTYNAHTLRYYLNKSKYVTLSKELNIDKMELLISNFKKYYESIPNVEVVVYGSTELMIMKHNLIKNSNCKYYLVDRNNMKYSIYKDNSNDNVNIIVGSPKELELSKYLKDNVSIFRCDFYEEDANTCKDIIRKMRKLYD